MSPVGCFLSVVPALITQHPSAVLDTSSPCSIECCQCSRENQGSLATSTSLVARCSQHCALCIDAERGKLSLRVLLESVKICVEQSVASEKQITVCQIMWEFSF